VGVFGSARRDETALSRRIFLAQGLSWVGIFSMFVFLAPVVTERLGLADDEQVGRAIAIALGLFNLVAAAVPIVLLMPLTKRFRRSHVHAAAMSVMALSFTLIGSWISDSAELWLCIALAGVGWGSLVSLPYVIFCDRVGSGRLGLMLGLFNVSVVVPQLVVSLGLGALAPSMTSKDDLFLIAAGALIASAIAWACIPPIQERAPA
jgi:MFS family permease